MSALFRAIAAVTVVGLAVLPAHAAAAELRPLEEGWERLFSVTWDAAQHGCSEQPSATVQAPHLLVSGRGGALISFIECPPTRYRPTGRRCGTS